MSTINSVGNNLSSQTGTGAFVGSITPNLVLPNINDVNGNAILRFLTTASAVNYIELTNASTGNGPILSVLGSDTNINLNVIGKGTGGLVISSLGNSPLSLFSGTAYQHETVLSFANTANTRTVTFPDSTGTVAFDSGIVAFTPTLMFGGSSTGITYSVQSGFYSMVGSIISYTLSVALTSKGAQTGNATIGGLPFTAGTVVNGAVGSQNISFTNQITASTVPSSTTISLGEAVSGSSAINKTNSDFTNTSQITISGFYYV